MKKIMISFVLSHLSLKYFLVSKLLAKKLAIVDLLIFSSYDDGFSKLITNIINFNIKSSVPRECKQDSIHY